MKITKIRRKWKFLFVILIIIFIAILALGAYFLRVFFFPGKVTLPPIEITRAEVKNDYIDLQIHEPEKLRLLEDFVNQFPDGWHIPSSGPVLAQIRFNLYNNDELVGEFGVSQHLLTRMVFTQASSANSKIIDKRWLLFVSEGRIKDFVTTLSPAVKESLYPVIPVSPTELESLSYWENKLSGLEAGMSVNEINEFIIENKIVVTADFQQFMNINLNMINEGEYVDTVIAAQLELNEDRSLERIRFFGYELSPKIPKQKTLFYWHHKLSDLPQGATFNEIEDFLEKNPIIISDCQENILTLKLFTLDEIWVPSKGEFADVVGVAQLIFDEDKRLKSIDLLGYQLSKKSDTVLDFNSCKTVSTD